MKKTIGILAHVDAGKTTFAEQLLYHTKSIRKKGRVDHRTSFLDSHNIEKERGITVFSDQGVFSYNDSIYYLIDTPGHIDFSPEMERAIQIMDYAIIIISAVEGLQSHTETVWTLLRKFKIPTIFFINKIDRVGADVKKVLRDIKIKFTKDCIIINKSLNTEEIESDVIEFIAERDEGLLEKYLEGNYKKEIWLEKMMKMLKENKIFPCFSGSALQNMGIEEMLDNIDRLTFTKYNCQDNFAGRVYKVRYDDDGNRVTYIKALKGRLKVRDEIRYGNEENSLYEKINQIRIYNGCKFKVVDSIQAGDVFSVIGLSNSAPGDGVGELKEKCNYEIIPMLKSKVNYINKSSVKDVLKYFKILEAEDPTLNVMWNEKLQEIHVHIMGIIQLEILKQLVEERFNLLINFGKCEILYKETISSGNIGCGHFEPLGHYAEVHLKLEPGIRDSGIEFNNICHVDNLTVGNQNLIRTHLYEKDHKGILTGSSLTDIKITLITGKSHNKHTSGGDFREATYRALRQGLEKVKNELLEPYYRFRIEVEIDYVGRVLSDIQKLHGTFETPEVIESKVIINGTGPVYTFMNYSLELISFTKGKGIINLNFSGYDYCHNKEEVIKKINYDKNLDCEYTSNSIFCSKGQSYIVNGSEVDKYMHCIV